MAVINLDPTDYVRFQDSDLDYSIWSPKYLADAVRFYRVNSTCTCQSEVKDDLAACTCENEPKDDLASLIPDAVSSVRTYLIHGEGGERTLDQVNVALQVLRMATIKDDLASLVAHAVSLVQTYLILGPNPWRTAEQVHVALNILKIAQDSAE